MKPSAIDDLSRDLTEGYLSYCDPKFAAMKGDEQRALVAQAIKHRLEDHAITSAGIAGLLNEILALDPECMYHLTCQMAPVNESIVNHPTIVVHEAKPVQRHRVYVLHFLGLLQGIAALDGHKIAAVYDGEGNLTGFSAITNAQYEEMKEQE